MAAPTWTQPGLLEPPLVVDAELASGMIEETRGAEATVAFSQPERFSQATTRKPPLSPTVPEATRRQALAPAGRNRSVAVSPRSEDGARPLNTSSCP
jgi:hypothetical protein